MGDSGFLFEEVVVCKLQMPFSGKFLQKEDMQNLSASALFIRFSWHWRML